MSILDKPIIAVDFDGTLTLKDNRVWYNNVPSNDIMEPRIEVINVLKQIRDNVYLILWTCRDDISLDNAVKFCKKHGLEFDKVNENVVLYNTSRKIMADYYLDDKNIRLEDVKWLAKIC